MTWPNDRSESHILDIGGVLHWGDAIEIPPTGALGRQYQRAGEHILERERPTQARRKSIGTTRMRRFLSVDVALLQGDGDFLHPKPMSAKAVGLTVFGQRQVVDGPVDIPSSPLGTLHVNWVERVGDVRTARASWPESSVASDVVAGEAVANARRYSCR